MEWLFGIDSIAHNAALANKVKTIAVLPCGLDKIFPEENKEIFKRIIENDGCVITEYEPNIKAKSKYFLQRNRIVSGISIGVLVVEAAYRSGTSVTVRFAKEQGKDVFCIPGSIYNIKSHGTNEFIKEGAKLVINAKDIMKNYDFIKEKINYVQKIVKNKESKEKEDDISKVYKDAVMEENMPTEYIKIYKKITNEGIDIDLLLNEIDMETKEVNSILTMLELDGKIIKKAGKIYRI